MTADFSSRGERGTEFRSGAIAIARAAAVDGDLAGMT